MSRHSDPRTADYWRGLVSQSAMRFFILRALWDKDSYGYALILEVRETSWGYCNPTESTLYPALAELEKHNLVRSSSLAVAGRQRKVYTITEQGKLAFRTAAKCWSEIVPAIRAASTL